MQTILSDNDDGHTGKLPAVRQGQSILRTFVALRHRNFRLFWSGQLISLIGTWMQSTAQSWLVLELTHSAWMLGIVGALQFLPILLFALFGGVLADRVPKRTVLLFTQSSALLQAAVLWVLVFSGAVQLWHVLLLATLLGLTNAVDMPTRQSFVVEMVGRDDLPNAVALNSSVFNVARIVGPGLAGLIISWLNVAPLFLLNALSFIPVIVSLALIDPHRLYAHAQKNTGTRQGTFQSLREGLVYVTKTPPVLLIIIVIGTVSLFGINFNVVLPLFATDVLHIGATGFGFLSSTFGLGSLLSALWIAWGNKKPAITRMLLASIAFCILEALFALSHWYALSLILIASVGFAQITFSALANTLIQTVTPDYLRGRIMSVYMMVFTGSIPLGNLFTGELANLFSTPIALLAGAALSFIAAIAGWMLRASAVKSLEQPTDSETTQAILAGDPVDQREPAPAH